MPAGLPRVRPLPPPLPPVPRVLWALVLASVIPELLFQAAEAGLVFAPDLRLRAMALFAFDDRVWDGRLDGLYPGHRWVMLVSHAFLHGGLAHLAMNAVVLLALGKYLAALIGPWRLLPLYVLSAAAGAVAFGAIADTALPMAGASGAAMGFIGLWQAGEWRWRRRAGAPVTPIRNMMIGLVLANLILWIAMQGLIAWEAHLGGFLAGGLLGFAWRVLSIPGGWQRAGPRA
jgi:membrane associated rhomboid family serine protease